MVILNAEANLKDIIIVIVDQYTSNQGILWGGFYMNDWKEYVKFHSDVKEAIINNIPVVALESTLISHAMPYPHNMDTAVALGSIIKKNG
jgi:hypothetical protein